MNAMLARYECRARGQAGGIRDEIVIEANTLIGDTVDVGARVAVIAVAAQVIRTEGVEV
jgi:hypothetical protein